MKKQFTYEFEEDEKDKVTFDYSPDGDERFNMAMQSGKPLIHANSAGLLTLARTLIKLALGTYSETHHIQLNKDFNAEKEEILTLMKNIKD